MSERYIVDLSPGDPVALIHGWHSRATRMVIDRVTKTQIVIGNRRFNRRTGREIGGVDWIDPWNEDHDRAEA